MTIVLIIVAYCAAIYLCALLGTKIVESCKRYLKNQK